MIPQMLAGAAFRENISQIFKFFYAKARAGASDALLLKRVGALISVSFV
jgi:hypothetical protein